jgi:hypothetical protein
MIFDTYTYTNILSTDLKKKKEAKKQIYFRSHYIIKYNSYKTNMSVCMSSCSRFIFSAYNKKWQYYNAVDDDRRKEKEKEC